MANIVCKHCGATGFSKCPICRTVFPDNQYEAMLSHMLKFSLDKDSGQVTITFKSFPMDESKPIVSAFIHLWKVLKRLNQHKDGLSFDKYACNHHWIFAPGQKSDIGCGCNPH